jgi:plasmid stabilization system protein ParE
MKYSFVNRPSVKDDILEAVDYYKQISPELAHLFIKRITEAKDSIALSPEGFQVRYKNRSY